MKLYRNDFWAWMFGLAAVALLAWLGWLAAESRAKVADAEMRNLLIERTVQIAADINTDLASKLTFTPSDVGTPAFECLREQMIGYGSAIPGARWLYCMTKRTNRIVFGIDVGFGDAEKTVPPAKPGDTYDDASERFKRLFSQKRPFTDGPCTDKWGTFVSACVPVFDRQTGKLLMLIGLDVDADDWNARVAAARHGPILITLAMIFAIVIGLFLIRRWNRRGTTNSLKLKAWIVVPTALAALAGFAILVAYEYRGNSEESRRNMLHLTEQAGIACDQYVNSVIQLLKSQIDHIANNRAMLKAWQNRNMAELNALSQPEFEELKRKYKITHFYFVDPDGTCFLRVHHPAQYGDRIERATMLTAIRTEEDTWGTELGVLGDCTLRYVRPWTQNGKVVGYLELGVEIGRLVDHLAQVMDAEIITVVRKQYTTRDRFESGQRSLGFDGHWDDYPNFVVVHQTAPQLSGAVMRELTIRGNSASEIEVFHAKKGERQFACGAIHMPDVAGRDVVNLIVVRDITVQSTASQRNLLWSVGLASVLIGGILMLLWSVTDSAEKQLSDAFTTIGDNATCMQAITGAAHDAILMIDPDGQVSYWNPAAERILGYTADEALGREICELLAMPQYCPEFVAVIRDFQHSGRGAAIGKTLELKARRKDGTEISIALSLSTIQIGGSWHAVGILRDETEAHRQREELRVSRERFAQVAETNGEIIWELDASGQYTYVSHACGALLGYDENELIGKLYFYDLHPEEGREEFRRQIFAGFDQRVAFKDLKNPIVAKDGRVLIVLSNGVPILNADGTLQGYRGSDRDITERQQAEETLQQQQAFLRRIIDTVPSFIGIRNASGCCVMANQTLAEAYGTTVQMLEGHKDVDFCVTPEEAESFRRSDFEVLEKREPVFVPEETITLADGSVHWITTTKTPLFEKDGSCTQVLTVSMDITKRKQAEEAMKNRIVALTRPLGDAGDIAFEDLFNLEDIQRLQDDFAKATGVGSIITHTDGTPITKPSNFCRLCDIIRKTGKGCANCYMSDATVGRYNPEGPIVQPCMSGGLWDAGAGISIGGQHIAKWLIGQVRDETQTEANIIEYARAIGADEQAVSSAFQEVPSMSREQFENVAKALFTLANQLSNAAYQNIQQARFITEHKRVEEALLQTKAELQQYVTALERSNEALQEANRLAEAATLAKSEFLANMSHEIRTPMTAILGYADIMLEENMGRATRKHVEVIKHNGNHLLDLINDILDLSKVEAGKMQIEAVHCSPVQLLDEVVSLMRVRADAKHLKLTTELTGPIPETVLTDPLRFRQVLVNLVGNAIKFTDEGEVRLAAQLIYNDGVSRLRVDVTDTGIGMNQEEVGKLFHAFTQVDSSATRKFGGSGMGLCISKHLAEILGGNIEVHSTPGKGSTFSVTIDPGPLDGVRIIQEDRNATVVRAPQISTQTADNKIKLRGRILLVEDGPDNQRLIHLLLKKAGADVVAVENGQLAIQHAMAAYEIGKSFDVILMDMQMPVMDGYTSTRRLREWGYTGPIIALTAHAMDHDRRKCLESGCDDYATKPIDRQKLLTTVAYWANRSQTQLNATNALTTTDETTAAAQPAS